MSKYLTRDRILEIQDFRTVEVEVPEWGGIVLVRELNALERDRLGFGMATPDGKVDFSKARGLRSKLAAWTIVDEDGNSVFSTKDIKQLERKSGTAIDRVADAIMELSGLQEKMELEIACPQCDQLFVVDLSKLADQYREAQQDKVEGQELKNE